MATDILMMVSFAANTPIAAECQAVVDGSDALTRDFKAGCYFELDDFKFGIKVKDKDSAVPSGANHNLNIRDAETGEKLKIEQPDGDFANFFSSPTIPKDLVTIYPITMDEASFSRQIDKSSPLLLKQCFNRLVIDSAAIVKRKVSGNVSGNNDNVIYNIPFFRIDFKNILLIDMEWSVSDNVIKEEIKFVCRTATAQYRPQKSDGSAGSVVSTEGLSLIKAPGQQ